jgi:hypothetical protein
VWVARGNTDDAFSELVQRLLSGKIDRQPPGIERAAKEKYSDAAIRPQVLELVEAMVSGGPAAE